MATQKTGLTPISSFRHTQNLESTEWIINHKIGSSINGSAAIPSVQVFINIDSVLTPAIPNDIEIISPGVIKISFTQPFSGIALIIV